MKLRTLLPAFLLIILAFPLAAQQKTTVDYVVRDSGPLKMDVYVPAVQNEHHACLIFLFGGGFMSGSRNDTIQVNPVVRWAMDNGYVLFVPDYRLGLKGASNSSIISGVMFSKSMACPSNRLPLLTIIRSQAESIGCNSGGALGATPAHSPTQGHG